MDAKIVDASTYLSCTQNIKSIYNSMPFAELNRNKVKEIIYLIVYKETSPRFCVTFGVDEGGNAKCPFSAPFGYIESIKKGQSIERYYEALNAVEQLLSEQGIKNISIILPPDFYDNDEINTWYNVLQMGDWYTEYVDISFFMHIPTLVNGYEKKISSNSRRNLKIALCNNMRMVKCKNEIEVKEAYRIIENNRTAKGYPLRMTEEQVLDTIRVVPAKAYLLYLEETAIASALIYDVSDKVAQVIYWGDLPGYSDKKAMNYMAYELMNIYNEMNIEYLDIGPSTENGIPNYGLCDFKDSIGCSRKAKFRFCKSLSKDM